MNDGACCGPQRDEPGGSATDSSPLPSLAGLEIDGGLDLVSIPGGTFLMGTDDPKGYPDDGEGPIHEVGLDPFEIGATVVTNAQFAGFVYSTGYRTDAERFGDSFVFAGLLPNDFPPTQSLAAAPWWRLVKGASWLHPEGPQSDLAGRGDYPVVHLSWADASAFCEWAGLRLPTEAEWERAARGGREGQHWPWGDEREPEGEHRMNVFQGTFPDVDTADDGFRGPAPVRSFPPNDFGLYEMTGNVWEWCADWYDRQAYRRGPVRNPEGPPTGAERVQRGGSYLCHESYCWRYRVDSRNGTTPDSSAGHYGFRVARSA